MTSGHYPHRVTVQSRTETADTHHGQTDAWATARHRIAARVTPLHGRDLERAMQIDPRISHDVELRYWRDYATVLDGGRARLVYHRTSQADDDRTFEIVGTPLDVDERHERLVMRCAEAA